VNRFIGDAIMALWGAPVEDPEQAVNAVLAACEIQQDMEALRRELEADGLPPIRARIGIHSCIAVVGNLGSADRFDYTAIGDGVNLAARLEGVNKLYRTKVLASGDTVAKLHGAVAMRRVDRVIVKGKSEPVEIYTPCADAAVIETTERAVQAFRARRWDDSLALWSELLERDPQDGVASHYVERIAKCRGLALGEAWDGALELDKL